ncbi:MAG: sulfotransferase domain-containing protein [Egibacteraceae bacterium]
MADNLRTDARVLVDVVRARAAQIQSQASTPGPPVFVNSLPKAGTNLLLKLMRLLPSIHHVRLYLNREEVGLYWPRAGEPRLRIGVDTPEDVSLRRVARRVRRLPPGTWFSGHVPYSPGFLQLLTDSGIRMLLIVRDPRDVVLSNAEYLASPPHRFSTSFSKLSREERVLASIQGLPAAGRRPALLDIRERVTSLMPWLRANPLVYVTRFEHLVGPAGGGCPETQVSEIMRIAEHLRISLDSEGACDIGQKLFGGTHTFRKGQIGGWREEFTEAHATAVKALLGDLLIELGYEESLDWGL